jgi:predicted transcriptional regulator
MMMVFEQDDKKSDRSNSSTRERMQITADILHHCTEIKRKSQVMQKANLNFDQVNHYLGNLLSRGLLEQAVAAEGGSRIYRTTEKGRKFLGYYHDMMQLFKDHFSNKQNKNSQANLNNESKNLVISRPRNKILAISFLLAVGLSMMVANSLPTTTTTTLLQEQQLAYAQKQQQSNKFPQSITAASSTDTTPHALKLKATQQGGEGENAQPKKVSGFKIDLTNVVTAQINSQVFVFVTDSSLKVIGAKVRTVSDQLIDLVPSTSTQANAFSLANLPVGVYTLDIMIQKGSTKAAYEGILVISQQPTIVINETIKQVINQEINQNTRVDTDVKVVFKKKNDKERVCLFTPSHPDCKPKDEKCPKGWAMNEDGNCFPAHKKCPEGHARMDNDETGACISFNNKDYGDGCPPGSANPEDGCTLEGYHCTENGCGYYSHGSCEQCEPRTGMEPVTLSIDPTITTTSEPQIGAGDDSQGTAGCVNAGQTEGEDECILDTPENRAELVRQAATPQVEELVAVPEFGKEDLNPNEPGLQQDDGEIVDDTQDNGGDDTNGVDGNGDSGDGDRGESGDSGASATE